MKQIVVNIKKQIAKLPLPFWLSFYIFLILLVVPTLAYLGSFGKAAPGTLTTTINQKSGTNDPNPSYTSVFTVQFNEAIDENTFTDSDITLGGTAPGQAIQSITEAGTFNKTTYEVRIQATSTGTITPTIAQELITAQNGASGTNQASTSTDNSVTYNGDWAPGEFVTTWKTDNPGVSGSNQITIPTTGGGYNYNVDWGDGNTSTGLTGNSTHTYASTGTYTVSITGTFPRIAFNNNGDRQKILTTEQWGGNPWVSMYAAFEGATNLVIPATDAPNLTGVTDMGWMLKEATSFNSSINHWNTQNVLQINALFSGATSFNQPLDSWDVSNVTYMNAVFSGAASFNQPLDNWVVSNVTSSMSSMFMGATSFNQPLNNWKLTTSGSLTMESMFSGATAFNQPLDSWDVSNVYDTSLMFYGATAFNQPLDNWDVSNIDTLSGMFYGATSFDQPLSSWNISNVSYLNGMFGNGSGLSTANYDMTLISWNQQALQNNVSFGVGASKYCASAAERQSIITNHSWTITDGGQDCASTRAPQVDTNSVTNITDVSATLNGATSPDTIIARGFQYGTTPSYGSTATDSSATIATYGSQGSGNGQFGFAYGVATDSSGNVYVADSANHRVQKFDSSGNFLMKFGTNGSGNGQLNAPDDVSIDSSGNIYVADSLNHRIQKFNSSGTYLSQFGTNGTGDGQFSTPASVTFDSSGNIYVADQDNHRIQKFDANGSFLMKFGSNGSGNGQFAHPHGVTVDSSGNIYVADTNNHRIQKFDSSGAYVSKWGSAGNGNGQFNYPSNTAIDKDGNIYVMDFFNHRVQKFSSNGFYISQFGSGGSGLTEFTFPHDLAFSPNGNLYIQDNLGYRLKRYTGTITANISGLTCGTTYHYRAYATNSYGTGYGQDQTFTTSGCAPDPFIMRVKTDNPGISNSNQYTIPTNTNDYSYNYNVDCNNDGTPEHSNQTGDVTCTYGSAGDYDIAITGTFPHLKNNTNAATDTEKITDVKQWGDIAWQDMSDMFYNATNIITFTATDIPDLSNVSDTSWMFSGATNFNTNINNWNTSNVTYMIAMFSGATSFNQPLNNWDVGNVSYMSFMFSEADSFNQPLNNWDVSNVILMVGVFDHATNFNQALSSWNVSSVTDMMAIFRGATSFNQPLNNWDVSNVTDMSYVFDGATSFNQPLNNWNVSNVTSMFSVFARANSFNQDINNWNISNVTNLGYIFNGAVAFNQPLNSWDVSNVTSMSGAFMNAASFNQPLNNWDVSNVTLMYGMFSAAFDFNQPLGSWDVSNVVGMSNMFTSASSFNQDINSWSVSNVTSMSGVFLNAVSFNQPLNNWNVTNVTDMTGLFVNTTSFDQSLASWDVSNVTAMPIMFGDFVQIYKDAYEQYYGLPYANWLQADKDNFWTYISSTLGYPVDETYTPNPSGLSMSNYDATLIAWSGQNLESNVVFHAGTSQYCASETQRQSMITNFTWTIIDAGKDCGVPPQQPFIMRVKTDNPGISNSNQYTIPTNTNDYSYNYNVDCNNDGTPEHSNQTGDVTCTYGSAGDYDIAITGTFPHMENSSNTSSDTEKIIDVKQWGDIEWQDMTRMFSESTNISVFTATDAPDLSDVADMNSMFGGATNFNTNINNWDVSSVIVMTSMFENASEFDQPLNNWDVSSVINMSSMFQDADAFNQLIEDWDTSSLEQISGMFLDNNAFNQPLNNWDVSNVLNAEWLFYNGSFNQPLNNWDVSSIQGFSLMFAGNIYFNQSLDAWDTSSADNMVGIFAGASSFDQSLANWEVGNVLDMTYMFGDANGNLLNTSGLSSSNYDATLISWSGQNLESNVTFDAGTSKYCDAETQRQGIITNFTWTINDAGKECPATSPTIPISPSVTEITTTSMKLSWSPPTSDGGSPITSYQVQYKASSSSTWISAPVQSPSPTTHVLTNLLSGTGYDLRVLAANTIGNSPYTSPITGTTMSEPILPDEPPPPDPDPPVYPPDNPDPDPDPETPTTDTETNTPVPGTPVYVSPTRGNQNSSRPKSTRERILSMLGFSQGSSMVKSIVSMAEYTPKPVAQAVPYSLLSLLIAISAFYIYLSYLETQRRKALATLFTRFKALLASRATYLRITSHYISTPITKMQGTIELLASGIASTSSSTSTGSTKANPTNTNSSTTTTTNPKAGETISPTSNLNTANSTPTNSTNSSSTNLPPPVALATTTTTLTIPENAIVVANNGLKNLANHASELLTEGQSLTGQQQANIHNLEKKKGLSFLTHPAFWLPVVTISTIVILLNIIFIQASRYAPTAITIFSQLMLGFVGALALGVSYYFYQQRKEQTKLTKQQQDIETEFNLRQANFIAEASNKLNDDILVLEGVKKDIAKYPKVSGFTDGLKDLKAIANQLEKLASLSKNVPGLTWNTNLNQTIATATQNIQPLADKQNVTITNNNLKSTTQVAVEEQALAHLITAPIKNAIQASQPGNQIKLTQTTNPKDKQHPIQLTITDQGKGIPADQLANIFTPFNSAHSLERFTDTGLGLDLYLCKVITTQYNATIDITSQEGEGTTVALGFSDV